MNRSSSSTHWLDFVIDGCIRKVSKDVMKVAEMQFVEHLGDNNGEDDLHAAYINKVVKYLKSAIDCGCYYHVFRFLINSEEYEDNIDIELIFELIAAEEQYKFVLDLYNSYKVELYNDMMNQYGGIPNFSHKTRSPYGFCEYLLSNILNKKIDLNNLNSKDIDFIVKDIDDNLIPGILLCFLDYAEYYRKIEVFYYILSEYVIPIMAKLNWNIDPEYSEHPYYIEIMKELLLYYINELEIILPQNAIFNTDNHNDDFWNDVIHGLLGEKEDCIVAVGKQIICNTNQFGSKLLKLYNSSKEQMKVVLRKDIFAFFTGFVALILQAEDEKIKAKDFLVENYDDMRGDGEQEPYKIIMLSKAIIASETFNETNILYGYFLYEHTMYYRRKESIIGFWKHLKIGKE